MYGPNNLTIKSSANLSRLHTYQKCDVFPVLSSALAWKIPWTEESGRLQSTGLQRVGCGWGTPLLFTNVPAFLLGRGLSFSSGAFHLLPSLLLRNMNTWPPFSLRKPTLRNLPIISISPWYQSYTLILFLHSLPLNH